MQLIQAYSVIGDLLTGLQESTPAFDALGNPIQLDPDISLFDRLGHMLGGPPDSLQGKLWKGVDLHGMPEMIQAIEKILSECCE